MLVSNFILLHKVLDLLTKLLVLLDSIKSSGILRRYFLTDVINGQLKLIRQLLPIATTLLTH